MSKAGPKIYSEEYYEALRAIEGRHWWTLGMDDIMDALLLPRLRGQSGLRVIDMGCGSGVGLAWARRRLDPAMLLGVDVSPYGIQYCRHKGAELLLGSVTELPVPSGSFDLAICNDVLQHVEDDQGAVNEAFRVLAPGGYLFVRTNGKFLLPRLPGCLRLYSRQALHGLLRSAGFDAVVVSSANALGSMIGVVKHYRVRLSERWRGSPAQSSDHHAHGTDHGQQSEGGILIKPGEKQGASVAERIMRGTLRAEGTLMNRFPGLIPFGHTHIMLARKF